MYYEIYTLLGWLLIIAATPFFIPYCLITGKHLNSLKQRFGFFAVNRSWQHQQRIWFHAASVGEVQVAKALIEECHALKLAADFIITTVTDQGQLVAQAQLGEKALCLYAPLDLPHIVHAFLRKLQPTAYVCLETELWPNIIRILRNNGVRTVLLNGRMSEKSFNNYNRFADFSRQVLANIEKIAVINDTDKKRYTALGYRRDKIVVTGNAKYSLRLPDTTLYSDYNTTDSSQQRYRQLLCLRENQPLLVAGSTHTGEETLLVEVYLELVSSMPGLVMILAPRHLERLAQIQKILDDFKVDHQRFSELLSGKVRSASIILLDTMGELRGLYSIATFVFCGGSLVEKGGHNIMEAALHGKAPIYGPHMKDFLDAVTLLENNGGGFMVANSFELKNLLLSFANKPDLLNKANEKAVATANAQQTAARNQVKILLDVLAH
nr:hypothetical protein [Desulfobulbaceae bacterium]